MDLMRTPPQGAATPLPEISEHITMVDARCACESSDSQLSVAMDRR